MRIFASTMHIGGLCIGNQEEEHEFRYEREKIECGRGETERSEEVSGEKDRIEERQQEFLAWKRIQTLRWNVCKARIHGREEEIVLTRNLTYAGNARMVKLPDRMRLETDARPAGDRAEPWHSPDERRSLPAH